MTSRPLTEDEYSVYAGSAALAVELIPSFRDSIVLLRPFADFDSECVYVDRYSRICLSKAFFGRSRYQRATTVLHETMHILNRHFERADAAKIGPSDAFLVSADFEIGTTLSAHPRADTSHQIVPDRDPYDYPPNLTFEQYYEILKGDDEDGQSGNPEPSDSGEGDSEDQDSGDSETDSSSDDPDEQQDSSGDAGDPQSAQSTDDEGDPTDDTEGQSTVSKAASESGCKNAGEAEEDDADSAGIERASDAETVIARQNTELAVIEAKKKSLRAGASAMGALLARMELLMQPPKANWGAILRETVSRANANIARGRSDFTYRRPNRRLSYGSFVFPGMLAYKPTTALGIDTSASMAEGDFQATLSEASAIIESNSGGEGVKIFSIDTQVAGKIETVRKIADITFKGGGGTDMGPAFTFLRKMPRREQPDIFVLATDGGVPWAPVAKELALTRKLFKTIILITDKDAFDRVTDEVKRMATVIDIS